MSEGTDDGGCMLIIGIVIVGIAVGNIWSAAYGWLVIGGCLVALGVLCILGRAAAVLNRRRG